MVKLISRIVSALCFWKPASQRKILRARVESRLYGSSIRRRARSVGRGLYVLGPGVSVTSKTTIGVGVGLGRNVKVYGGGEVTIGDHSGIAEDTVIYTQNHDYDRGDALPFGENYAYKPVRIDECAWIGMRCFILPGAHIGEGAVIQACSVVQGDIPPLAIAGGNPARVFASRDRVHYERLKAEGRYAMCLGVKRSRDSAISQTSPAAREEIGPGNVRPPVSMVVKASAAGASGDNLERYTAVFCEIFKATPESAPSMRYQETPAWDSAGQMALVEKLEETFGVEFEPDDMVLLRSFDAGRRLLEEKYGVAF